MRLFDIKQLSEILNVKPKTIYDWTHKGQIPYIKIGRLLRFDLNDIERWIRNKKHNRFSRN